MHCVFLNLANNFKQMKALFYHPHIINSPLTTAPLAYISLATQLKGSNIQLDLLDGRTEPNAIDKLSDRIENYDVLMITAMPGSQIKTGLEACRVAKEINPDIKIIWGGSHSNVAPEITISSDYIDIVVVGRGEFVIQELLEKISNNERLDAIPNLFIKANGKISSTPKVNFNTKSVSEPDYSVVESIEPYICQTRKSNRVLDYISSFGCPFKCSFCYEPLVSKSIWSYLRADKLYTSIICLVESYNLDCILFQDANFVANVERLEKFCKLIINGRQKVNWISTARLSDITKFHNNGTLKLMQESGCE